MSTITINVADLPTHGQLLTSHWSADERILFGKAVDGIRGAAWFQSATTSVPEHDIDRVAKAMAFAALGECRRRLRLSSDDNLMLDTAGMGR